MRMPMINPIVTLALARNRAAVPAARDVIQNRCGAVLMPTLTRA
jgi:hypothetical protein